MPTYEYECTKCGGIMELFQSITAKPKRTLPCATCKKSSRVRRLIGTGGGIVFKGSGFYTTDYRSENYKKGAESEKPAADGKKAEGAAKKDESAAAHQSRERERPVGESKPSEPAAAPEKSEKPKSKKSKED